MKDTTVEMPMTRVIEEYLEKRAHLTGSAAYGLPCPRDRDYFCTVDVYGSLIKLAEEQKIKVTPGGSTGTSVCIVENYTVYNVFVVSQPEIKALQLITRIMTDIYKLYPTAIATKAVRVLLYESLRALMKLCRSIIH